VSPGNLISTFRSKLATHIFIERNVLNIVDRSNRNQ